MSAYGGIPVRQYGPFSPPENGRVRLMAETREANTYIILVVWNETAKQNALAMEVSVPSKSTSW